MRKYFSRMSNSIYLCLLLSFTMLLPRKDFAQEKKVKKNILFIAVDDLKPILGCYGDERILSPNIEALAKRGTVFLNNYCQQAVCAPTRASLLTGLRPDKTKVWDLKTVMRDYVPDILTFPQYLIANGYETAATGKVFDPRSVDSGHDVSSWSIPYAKASGKRWLTSSGEVSTEAPENPESDFADTRALNKSIELMDSLVAGDKPFFLAVGFKKPHLPFVAPKKYWDLYNRDDFEIHPFQEHAENAPEFAFQPGNELRKYDDIPKSGALSEEKQKELIHGYYACVSYIDDLVGRLIRKLDERGLKDNTVIVLWGDHGWHLGDHGMWCKHTNFEQATRSPLIISSPDIEGDKQSDSPTEFVDVFPTLCELAGVDIPEYIDGASLVPVMNNPKVKVKNFAVSQFQRDSDFGELEGYAFRNERFRYVVWLPVKIRTDHKYSDNKVVARELYDYEKDPMEKISVVDDPEYSEVVEYFRKQVKSYFENQQIH